MKYIIKVQLGFYLSDRRQKQLVMILPQMETKVSHLRVLGPELLAAPRHQRRRVVHQLSPAPRPGDCPAPCHAPSLGQQPGVCSQRSHTAQSVLTWMG